MSVYHFPVNPQSTLSQTDLHLQQMRSEDRRVRRGIAMGVIAGLLIWPLVIGFAWFVLAVSGVRPW